MHPATGFSSFDTVDAASECVPTMLARHPLMMTHALTNEIGSINENNADLSPALKAGRGYTAVTQQYGSSVKAGFQGQQFVGDGDVTPTFTATSGNRSSGSVMLHQNEADLRRLTEIEAEQVQGFPIGYTAIPWKRNKKLASDPEAQAYYRHHHPHLTEAELLTLATPGIRYHALGNSWAVPCARWLGLRIDAVEAALGAL